MDHAALYIDGTCRFCMTCARFLRASLRAQGIIIRPFQGHAARREFGEAVHNPDAMLLRIGQQHWQGGAAALRCCRYHPWFFPLRCLAWWGWTRQLVERVYRWVAAHRSCGANASSCQRYLG